jgi:hypothetical protein
VDLRPNKRSGSREEGSQTSPKLTWTSTSWKRLNVHMSCCLGQPRIILTREWQVLCSHKYLQSPKGAADDRSRISHDTTEWKHGTPPDPYIKSRIAAINGGRVPQLHPWRHHGSRRLLCPSARALPCTPEPMEHRPQCLQQPDLYVVGNGLSNVCHRDGRRCRVVLTLCKKLKSDIQIGDAVRIKTETGSVEGKMR